MKKYRHYLILLFLLTTCLLTMTILVQRETTPLFLFYTGIFFAMLLLLLNGYVFYVLSAQTKKCRVPEILPAENAGRAKTAFLAHVSHELRTPLTTISGIAEILGNDKTLVDERQKKLVTALASSSLSLKALAGEIHDFLKNDSEAPDASDRNRIA
jgi:signal transduction histidine kinase